MTTTDTSACRDMLRSISAYLDGELDASACEAVEAHCRTCPGCAALVDGLRETVGLCRKAGAARLPPDVRERARQAVQRLLDTT